MTGIRVVPAILTDNPQVLRTMLQQAETFTGYAQIDIMDGKFVPSRSITMEQLDSLPGKLCWEAHLMVEHPEDYLKGLSRAGAKRVIFHYEAAGSPREVSSLAGKLGLKAGIAVNPETPVSAILPLADETDSVLFMSVNPGFYGASFIPGVLDKIEEFRRLRPGMETGIDGGVKEGNIARIAQSGVDVIYVGSAIFLQPEPGKSYHHLLALAQGSSQHLH